MAKQSDMNRMMLIGGALLIVAVVVGIYFGGGGSFAATTSTSGTSSPTGAASVSGVVCADDLSTTLTVTQYNPLNTSAEESYDQTARIYKVESSGEEQLFATLSDVTSGSANLNCGDTYRVRLESADASNARIDMVRSGEGAEVIESGRAIEFVAQGANYNLEFESPQRASLQVKAFDLDQNAWVFADDAQSASAYRESGVTFQGTVDNSTATSVGQGESIDWRFDIESTGTDTDSNDFGMYILVDASTNVWDEPELRYEGTILEDVTGQLDVYEGRAFSDYEYVYRIDGTIEDNDKTISLQLSALDDINPGASDDVSIDFAGIGAVKEISGSAMRYSATNNAASPTNVFTLQTFGINVS